MQTQVDPRFMLPVAPAISADAPTNQIDAIVLTVFHNHRERLRIWRLCDVTPILDGILDRDTIEASLCRLVDHGRMEKYEINHAMEDAWRLESVVTRTPDEKLSDMLILQSLMISTSWDSIETLHESNGTNLQIESINRLGTAGLAKRIVNSDGKRARWEASGVPSSTARTDLAVWQYMRLCMSERFFPCEDGVASNLRVSPKELDESLIRMEERGIIRIITTPNDTPVCLISRDWLIRYGPLYPYC